MRAGAAQTNITPLIGTPLAGAFHSRIARDIRDELRAKAIVLDDGDTRVAFVICDIIALPRETVTEAREIIERTCDMPGANALIAATHTHTAASPAGLLGTPRADQYMDALPAKIADSVRRACERLQPAKWGVALGRETRLTFNRRFRMKDGSVRMNPGVNNPDIVECVGPIDPDLPILHVANGETGRSVALIANFALHYVGGRPGDVASADYFGMFAETMQRWMGESFVVALANGFCGDVNNIDVATKRTRTEGWEQAEHVARVLASNALGLVEGMAYQEGGRLRVVAESLEIPIRPITDEVVENARATLGDRPHTASADGYSRDEIYARETLFLKEHPPTITTEAQVIALDRVGFLALPGEMFAQFGLDIAAASPLKPLFKVELANDYVGYVPTVKAFDESGYETQFARSSKLVPEAGDMMMAASERLLKSV